MPIQSVLVRPRQVRSAQRFASLVKCPTVGQCFDIEATRDADGWMIRIPEIGRVTRASRRATARPMPAEAPVTSAVLPRSSIRGLGIMTRNRSREAKSASHLG